MIVVCTSCRARFRISDDKVGPRGARVRCSKCKSVFAVDPAPAGGEPAPLPPAAATPSAPARPPPLPRRDDPFALASRETPTAPAPVPAKDPFASFASPPADIPEPTPVGFDLAAAASAAPRNGSTPAPSPGFLGSLPVTNLADLEKTGARRVDAAAPPPPAAAPDADLALEERTPVGIPVQDGQRAAGDLAAAASAQDFDFPPPDAFGGLEYSLEYGPPAPEEPTAPGMGAPVGPPEEPPFEVASPAESSRGGVAPAAAAPGGAPVRGTPRGEEEVGPVEADTLGAGRLHGILVNAVSLALLLVFTAGILLWWRGESVLGVVRRAARGTDGSLAVIAKENGYYETSSGRPLVFVRGEVRSQAARPVGRVRVRAEMVQAGRVVARTEGLAGAVPTPEELAPLGSTEEAERLRAVLAPRAPEQIPPGRALPFLVTFLDYPPDMADVTFRVAADPAPGP